MTSRSINPQIVELPPTVRLERGEGGLLLLRVATPDASAEIYLQGAHLTAWHPTGQRPVIWLSNSSAFLPGSPIRGGIPICFPWFGPNATDAAAPLHGFARLHDWTLVAASDVDDGVSLTFQLTDSQPTHSSPWPFRFAATYRVVVGAALQLSLEITNRDTETMEFDEALHAYYAVSDVRLVAIRGFTAARYLNRLATAGPVSNMADPVRIDAETDRIYSEFTGTVTIEDPHLGRVIRIRKEGSLATVIWNPWIDKSRTMSDFGDDEWVQMICIETCNTGSTRVLLAPGEVHRMTTIIDTHGKLTQEAHPFK